MLYRDPSLQLPLDPFVYIDAIRHDPVDNYGKCRIFLEELASSTADWSSRIAFAVELAVRAESGHVPLFIGVLQKRHGKFLGELIERGVSNARQPYEMFIDRASSVEPAFDRVARQFAVDREFPDSIGQLEDNDHHIVALVQRCYTAFDHNEELENVLKAFDAHLAGAYLERNQSVFPTQSQENLKRLMQAAATSAARVRHPRTSADKQSPQQGVSMLRELTLLDAAIAADPMNALPASPAQRRAEYRSIATDYYRQGIQLDARLHALELLTHIASVLNVSTVSADEMQAIRTRVELVRANSAQALKYAWTNDERSPEGLAANVHAVAEIVQLAAHIEHQLRTIARSIEPRLYTTEYETDGETFLFPGDDLPLIETELIGPNGNKYQAAFGVAGGILARSLKVETPQEAEQFMARLTRFDGGLTPELNQRHSMNIPLLHDYAEQSTILHGGVEQIFNVLYTAAQNDPDVRQALLELRSQPFAAPMTTSIVDQILYAVQRPGAGLRSGVPAQIAKSSAPEWTVPGTQDRLLEAALLAQLSHDASAYGDIGLAELVVDATATLGKTFEREDLAVTPVLLHDLARHVLTSDGAIGRALGRSIAANDSNVLLAIKGTLLEPAVALHALASNPPDALRLARTVRQAFAGGGEQSERLRQYAQRSGCEPSLQKAFSLGVPETQSQADQRSVDAIAGALVSQARLNNQLALALQSAQSAPGIHTETRQLLERVVAQLGRNSVNNVSSSGVASQQSRNFGNPASPIDPPPSGYQAPARPTSARPASGRIVPVPPTEILPPARTLPVTTPTAAPPATATPVEPGAGTPQKPARPQPRRRGGPIVSGRFTVPLPHWRRPHSQPPVGGQPVEPHPVSGEAVSGQPVTDPSSANPSAVNSPSVSSPAGDPSKSGPTSSTANPADSSSDRSIRSTREIICNDLAKIADDKHDYTKLFGRALSEAAADPTVNRALQTATAETPLAERVFGKQELSRERSSSPDQAQPQPQEKQQSRVLPSRGAPSPLPPFSPRLPQSPPSQPPSGSGAP